MTSSMMDENKNLNGKQEIERQLGWSPLLKGNTISESAKL